MKPTQPRSKGLIMVSLLLVCRLLMGVLLCQLFTALRYHEVCSVDVGDDRVTVYRIGWASPSGNAKFRVMLGDTPLLEYDCTGKIMTTPSAAISLSEDGVLIESIGDGYAVAIQLALSQESVSALWYLKDESGKPISNYDLASVSYHGIGNLQTVQALTDSVALSYNSQAFD